MYDRLTLSLKAVFDGDVREAAAVGTAGLAAILKRSEVEKGQVLKRRVEGQICSTRRRLKPRVVTRIEQICIEY